jgi:uncharacterized membrane protein
MVRIEVTAVIKRPVAEVFEFIVNNENDVLWQAGVLESSDLSTVTPEVGATYTQVAKLLGRRVETTNEVTAYELNRIYNFKSISGPIPTEGSVTCEAVAQGETQVTLVGQAEVGGFFKLAEPLVARMLQREWDTNMANLKDLLEKPA